jgi:hypothetical protein
MSEGEPVRIPAEVLKGLEAVRRYTGTDAPDIPTLRYVASERGQRALVVWIDQHEHDYAQGLLNGFEVED